MGCVACKAAKASNGDPLDFWWWKLNQQRDDPLGITVGNCPLVLEQGDSNWPEKTRL